jgi:tRNA(Ile)-lysidine synthase
MDFTPAKKILAPFKGYKVYAGFSGGADSTALLLALHTLAAELSLKLQAVHFEHGLRGQDSLDDAAWCEDFCKSRKIPFTGITLDVLSGRHPGENIEAAARRMRIQQWIEMLAGQEKAVVALGHHAGDRIENMFIRLCRGSNISGLTAMRTRGIIHGVTLIRPLLHYHKDELTTYLWENDICDWRTDKSNFDSTIARNFFRHEIIPLIKNQFPHAEKGLLQAAETIQLDADFIEQAAMESFKIIRGSAYAPVAFWTSLHPAVSHRVLRLWLSKNCGRDMIPDSCLGMRFNEAVRKFKGETMLIPVNSEIAIRISGSDCAVISNSELKPETVFEIPWCWTEYPLDFKHGRLTAQTAASGEKQKYHEEFGDLNTAVFDAAMLPDILHVTERRDGDRMTTFGTESPVKLKKLITDRKLSAIQKDNLPVIRIPDGNILWVPGVRRSNFATVTDRSTRIVILRWELFQEQEWESASAML